MSDDISKKDFIRWNGEAVWKKLCEDFSKDKDFIEYLTKKKNTTVEGFVHRFVVWNMLYVLGWTNAGKNFRQILAEKPTTKRVLHFNGEYGVQIFDASTGEALDKAALKLLKERVNNGCFPDEGDYYSDASASRMRPHFNLEEIEAMKKDSAVRHAAEQEHENYAQYLKSKKRYERDRKDLKKALAGSGEAALQLLLNLNNHGSRKDEVSIINVESVE